MYTTIRHPGAILREHIIEPLHWTEEYAATVLHIETKELSSLLHESSCIDSALAQRLEELGFGQAEAWLYLQEEFSDYDDEPPAQAA